MKIIHHEKQPHSPERLAALVSACLEAIRQRRTGELVYIRPQGATIPVGIGGD